MSNTDSPSAEDPTTPIVSAKGLLSVLLELGSLSVLVAGAATFLARSNWIADLAANLRVQLVIAGCGAMIVAAVAKRYKWMALQSMMICVHLPWLLDVPLRAERGTGSALSLTVTAVNVYINNRDHDRIATVLSEAQADIIAVFEINETLFDHLQNELAGSHPYIEARPLPHPFGVVVFSRYPLSDVNTVGLDSTGGSILVTVDINGHPYRIAAVHPTSPMSARNFEGRHDHLAQVQTDITEWQQEHPDEAVVMIGDFNLTPWSPHFVDLLETTGLQHVAEGTGMEPSWYALPVFPFGLALDHCLINDRLKLESYHFGPSVHSDHRVLTVELSRAQERKSQTTSAVD